MVLKSQLKRIFCRSKPDKKCLPQDNNVCSFMEVLSMQHKYWKTTKLSWLTIIICPTQTWSTNNSSCIRLWLVVCLQLIVKTGENLLERYFFGKNRIKLRFVRKNTKKIVKKRCYKIYYDVSRKVQ